MQQPGQLHLLVAKLVLQVDARILRLSDAHIGGGHVKPGAHAAFHALLHFVAVGLQGHNLSVLHPNAFAHKQDVVVHLRGVERQVTAGHGHVVLRRLHLRFGQLYGCVALAEIEQQVLRRDVGIVVVVGRNLKRLAAQRYLHHGVDAGIGSSARYLRQKPGARLGQPAGSRIGQLIERGNGRVGIQH